jgi:phosphoserine aminotransferase
MKSYFLTPGPSELYYTVPEHIQQALKENVCSISHRSGEFQEIYKQTVDNLKKLLGIPTDFHVVFTGSANEIWERLIENCVENTSYHLVNGSFSKRFYETATELNRKAIKAEVSFGQGFDVSGLTIDDSVELICATHNETSSGVMMPLADIYALATKNPKALLAVDAVSSLPYPDFDYSKIDSVFFSVQKGFGLPAGLGVWILNERIVAKSKAILAKGKSIGSYHAVPAMIEKSSKNQTVETPNVLGIYLLGKVCADMLARGIDSIRNETNYKAALIYHALENNPRFKAAVQNEAHRSKTVIVADITDGRTSTEVIASLKPHGLIVGKGYGNYKDTQIRIANFPTFSKEVFEKLADLL